MEDMKERLTTRILNFITRPKIGILSKALFGIILLAFLLSFIEKYISWFRINPLRILPKESLYWLFSTIAQSMAAMFGIGGLFAAHVFHNADKAIEQAYEEAKRKTAAAYVPCITNVDFYDGLSDRIDYPEKRQWISQGIVEECRKAKTLIDSRISIRRVLGLLFKNVSIYMTLVIVFSLIALPFSYILSGILFGSIFTLLLMLAVVISIAKMVRFVFGAVKSY